MFQGWKVLGATVFTQALQAGLLIYAFGVIILPFQSEFDASRQSLMFATVLLSLVTNIISPFVGVRVDQAGVRRLMMLGAALLAMGFVALSLVTASDWNLMISIERYLKLDFERRSLPGLKARYSGPKKLKASGKAAGGKKKKSTPAKTRAKSKSRQRNKKNTGKPEAKTARPAVPANDGFAPLMKKKPAS